MNTIMTIVFFAVFAGIIYLGYKLITKKNTKPSKGGNNGGGDYPTDDKDNGRNDNFPKN